MASIQLQRAWQPYWNYSIFPQACNHRLAHTLLPELSPVLK